MLNNRRTLCIYVVVFLVAIILPYGLMYLRAPADHTFTGFISLSADDMTYLAKMRQGYEGSWLYRDPYTPEFVDAPGQPIFLLYLFLGHVASSLHLPLVAVFHVARVLLGLLLAALILSAVRVVIGCKYFAGALILATFGAGFEWVSFFGPDRLFFVPVPEAYAFTSALFYPHFTAALASYLSLLSILVFEWPAPRSAAAGIGLVAASLVLTSIHPYMWLVVAVTVAAVYVVERRSLRHLYWAVPWLAPAALYAVYMLWLFATSPVLGAWRGQTSTSFDMYWLLMLAPLLLAALTGLFETWRARPYGRRLVVWAAAQGLLLMLPLSFSRRLIEGWGLSLGMIAGVGLMAAWQRNNALPRLLAVVSACLLLITPLVAVVRPLVAPISAQYVSTWVRDDALELFNWMREELPRDTVVLCSPDLGNQVPAYTNRTVVMGHWSETIDSEQKAKLWRELRTAELPIEEVLEKYPITHIVAESDELRSRLSGDPLLDEVYKRGRYSVYAVVDR